jgi:signal transduction histidine kinase
MLVLILASVLIVLVLGGLWIYTTREHLENEVLSSDIDDSTNMADFIKLYLNDITSNVEVIANNPNTITSFQNNDTGSLMQIADNLNRSTPKPDAVAIINTGGQILYSTKYAHAPNITIDHWYGDMVKSSGPYVTGLYLSHTLDEYSFAILTPVKDNNSAILGRIMIVFTSESLQNLIRGHKFDPRDTIVVVDRSGNVVSSNNLSVIRENTDLSGYSPVRRVMGGENGVLVHNDSWDSQVRVTGYHAIPGSSWGVLVSTPLSVEYQPLYDQIAWILGMLAFFVLVFSAFGYFASKYLTDPISNLSRTMRQISGGDYDLRVKTKRNDEIGELAHTFNSMMDRLEEAKSRSDVYLDLMGHDISNMNQVALGYLEMADQVIVSGKQIGDENRDLVKKPIEALEGSSELIDNVRKLQKVKTETVQVKKIDLCEIISALKSRYSQSAGREISIKFEYGDKCIIYANELVADVFSNLIWNAIKHSDARQPLIINILIDRTVIDGQRYYRVAVEDTGPGISDEIKGKLFLRFSRGRTKAKGSGLGLYLVKTLVDSFHGTITVEDRVPGEYTKGVRFVVILPAADV